MTAQLLETMMMAAHAAGRVIMDVYDSEITTTKKADGSPVTQADQQAEDIILDALKSTGIPVLAEESAAAGKIPELGDRFFVVDPLDGTKEFIKRNGEFTVNIALVENGAPVMGVVTAPALGKAFFGSSAGAFACDLTADGYGPQHPISTANKGPMRVVASRSHKNPLLANICNEFSVEADVSVGSSLKFCLLAQGDAQFYPRLTPTCEWDTAAGQAVLEAAGGAVVRIDGTPLGYGKSEDRFYNPFFVAGCDITLAKKVAHFMKTLPVSGA